MSDARAFLLLAVGGLCSGHATAAPQQPVGPPVITANPANPVVGKPVTFTVRGGPAHAGNRMTLFFQQPGNSMLAIGFGQLDSSGDLSFTDASVPAATEGMAFTFFAAGVHPDTGLWKTSPCTVRVADERDFEDGLLASKWRISQLPMSGSAWDDLMAAAQNSTRSPDLSDQDDDTDVYVLAKALVYARTGDQSCRNDVIAACVKAIGTERGGRTLALGRNLSGYVIAADLVGLPASDDAAFRSWLRAVIGTTLSGRTLRSTHEDRPNNWGAHAGAARMAVAIYLGDSAELAAAADVFRGFVGDRATYSGFVFGELSWQADQQSPVGINPVGAVIGGRNVDGVIPDDQRRGGSFGWAPPKENYVWECLQGAFLQAMLLHRNGYDVFNWQDQALLRAVNWLHVPHFRGGSSYPAQGDDEWQPWLVNWAYGTAFPTSTPAGHGKSIGWVDWFAAAPPASVRNGPAAAAPR